MTRDKALSAAAIVAAGLAVLWLATDGLAAFTAEGARRLAVKRQPKPLPAVEFVDHNAKRFSFDDYRGRIVLVEFIYSRCGDICLVLGDSFERIRAALPPDTAPDRVQLLSISFDQTDGPDDLTSYAERFHADGHAWRIVRPVEAKDIATLLKTVGVTVIADGFGGFQHNAAVHLIDERGRLARIYGFSPPAAILERLWTWL